MENFSSLNLGMPRIPLQETNTKKVLKMESESGYIRSRSRSVRGFKTFTINYNDLSVSNIEDLIEFFDLVSGDAFVWQHPITSDNYNVIFQDESINYTYNEGGYVETSFTLREVW